ncbi:unnamed protein product [Calicophoron daubneyi]|uniref:Uncharacterized protein n=1 Tax=Calicophoron daubneyi TaxID=300641 RepID=A0AAV2TWC3_CALDB
MLPHTNPCTHHELPVSVISTGFRIAASCQIAAAEKYFLCIFILASLQSLSFCLIDIFIEFLFWFRVIRKKRFPFVTFTISTVSPFALKTHSAWGSSPAKLFIQREHIRIDCHFSQFFSVL